MREFIEAGLSENPEPEGRRGETKGKEGGGRARGSLCRAPAPTYFRKKRIPELTFSGGKLCLI